MNPTNVPVTRSDRISIRLAQGTDLASIQSVIEAAFAAEENKLIRDLSADLFKETTRPPIKSLVAELGGKLIGYVCYSPVFLKSTTDVSGYILSPLAVSPEYQSQGVGSALINSGIDMLQRMVLAFYWSMVTLITIKGSVLRKKLDVYSFHHTH